MEENENLEEELTSYIHDLFLNLEYVEWRKSLKQYEATKWYSLIVKLDEIKAPIDRLKGFSESIYSKLVFNYTKAP